MKSLVVLAVLVAVGVGDASEDCLQGNCTEPEVSVDIESIFPIFGPVDDSNSDSISDLSNEILRPPQHYRANDSHDSLSAENILAINFMQITSLTENTSGKFQKSKSRPVLQFIFRQTKLLPSGDHSGVLDLSRKTLTGEELFAQLRSRQQDNQPVSSLRLSNSRIHGLNMHSFQPVETTLNELHMDNCTVTLAAFNGFTNLRLLNLSNTGLATFEWFPQLMESLEVLDLSYNNLVEVSPELSVLTNLRKLDLSYNKIHSVNTYPLILLPNLRVISLTMNSLDNATFTSLSNLELLEVDWNYLRLFGYDLQLPSHRFDVKLASNPWRCDCRIMDARDNYDVLDLDVLECATYQSYSYCDNCQRIFLPRQRGELVATLTKKTVKYVGCTGLLDQWYILRRGVKQLKDHEPEKLLRLELLFLFCMLLPIIWVLIRYSNKKRFNRQSWLKIQQIPYLKIGGLNKPEEVPYIKIDGPEKA